MAEKLGDGEVVLIEEVVVSHAYEMMALIAVLEKKGILSRAEIQAKALAEMRALKLKLPTK